MMSKQNEIVGRSRTRRGRKLLWLIAVCTFIVLVGAAIYLSDYYHAGTVSAEMITAGGVARCDAGWVIGDPSNAQGFIFYPGGKVEATAYLPLLKQVADEGVLCVLCEMPFNLAVLNANAADIAIRQFPDIESWCIGGHSLGGSMAAKYASEHPDDIDGLVLLGAYPVSRLPEGIPTLLIYGSKDGVMNRIKYAQSLDMLPEYAELVINGGNHAGFGDYGAQTGDGASSISSSEQQEQAANAISRFLHGEHQMSTSRNVSGK